MFELVTARARGHAAYRGLFVGVSGGSGAGKSHLCAAVRATLGEESVCILPMDSYYLPRPDLTVAERAKLNFDHPDALDFDRVLRDLTLLGRGETVWVRAYDFTTYSPTGPESKIQPARIVLLDGLFALGNRSLRELLDLGVFVEADPDVRLVRRLRRDTIERGRSLDSVLAQYEESVRPMHSQYVQPTAKHADVVVNGNEAVSRLVLFLRRAVADWRV